MAAMEATGGEPHAQAAAPRPRRAGVRRARRVVQDARRRGAAGHHRLRADLRGFGGGGGRSHRDRRHRGACHGGQRRRRRRIRQLRRCLRPVGRRVRQLRLHHPVAGRVQPLGACAHIGCLSRLLAGASSGWSARLGSPKAASRSAKEAEETEALTLYERCRLKQIEVNHAILTKLGLQPPDVVSHTTYRRKYGAPYRHPQRAVACGAGAVRGQRARDGRGGRGAEAARTGGVRSIVGAGARSASDCAGDGVSHASAAAGAGAARVGCARCAARRGRWRGPSLLATSRRAQAACPTCRARGRWS